MVKKGSLRGIYDDCWNSGEPEKRRRKEEKMKIKEDSHATKEKET